MVLGGLLSVLITYLSWFKFWTGFGVFTLLGAMSKLAAGSVFSVVYYTLEPLAKILLGANFHWYLTRFVHLALLVTIFYFVYPLVKKMLKVICKREDWSDTEFTAALFILFFSSLALWQKAIFPWYLNWILPFGIITLVKFRNKYLERVAIWLSFTSLFSYVAWIFYRFTTGLDAGLSLWFFWFMFLTIFAYPIYNFFRWRRENYKLDQVDDGAQIVKI